MTIANTVHIVALTLLAVSVGTLATAGAQPLPAQSLARPAASASLGLVDSVLVLETDIPVMGGQCSIAGTGSKGIAFVADTVLQHFSVGMYAPSDTLCNLVLYTISGPPLPVGRYRLGHFTGLPPGRQLRNIILSDEHGSRIPTGAELFAPGSALKDLTCELFPNPCTSQLHIAARPATVSHLTIRISTMIGTIVFFRDIAVALPERILSIWNCCDLSGQPAPSGMYLCRITDPAGNFVQQLVMLRR